MGVPDFLRSDGPPWTANILAPYADWGIGGPSSSQNLTSGSGEYSDSVHINWNQPDRNLPIYHLRVFENTYRAGRRSRDNLLRENCTYRIQSPSTCQNPIRGHLVNRRDGTLDDHWDFMFPNNLCGEFLLLVSMPKFPSLV